MNRRADTYSRVIAALKVVLPLLALAVLATLFLFARGTHEQKIPYAKIDLDALAREQRLGNPSYAAVTDDGSEISFRAEVVRPDPTDRSVVNSRMMAMDLVAPDGASVSIVAQDGVIDGPAEVAELAGDVTLTTSQGYIVNTDRIAATLDTATVESPGAVDATGPVGTFHAGRMIITTPEGSDTYLVVFKDGVKLIYEPDQ